MDTTTKESTRQQLSVLFGLERFEAPFRYRPLNISLGNGNKSMGVWKAVSDDGRQPYAVKKFAIPDINPKEILGSDYEGRTISTIVREYQRIRDLNHPNIVKYLALNLVPRKSMQPSFAFEMWMLMEFCESTLKEEIEKLKRNQMGLDEEQIRSFTRQILHGVQYLHDQRMVHLDIKTENILLHGGVIKIADFGETYQLKGDLTRTSEVPDGRGTPLYMSPEMHLKDPKKGRLLDIWSTGCVLLEMLTGDRPRFRRMTAGKIQPLTKADDVERHIAQGNKPYIPEKFLVEHPIPFEQASREFLDRCFVNISERPKAKHLLELSFITGEYSKISQPSADVDSLTSSFGNFSLLAHSQSSATASTAVVPHPTELVSNKPAFLKDLIPLMYSSRRYAETGHYSTVAKFRQQILKKPNYAFLDISGNFSTNDRLDWMISATIADIKSACWVYTSFGVMVEQPARLSGLDFELKKIGLREYVRIGTLSDFSQNPVDLLVLWPEDKLLLANPRITDKRQLEEVAAAANIGLLIAGCINYSTQATHPPDCITKRKLWKLPLEDAVKFKHYFTIQSDDMLTMIKAAYDEET